MLTASLLLALLPVNDTPAPAPAAWILTCDVGRQAAAGAPTAVRVFRVAPSLIQEWKADRKAFGPNLCLSFRCTSDRGRLEGSIESRTLVFTLTFDPQARSASWRTVGASGNARTSGPCAARAEAAAPRKAPARSDESTPAETYFAGPTLSRAAAGRSAL